MEVRDVNNTKNLYVPICEKMLLTIEEASIYSNIGKDKLYQLTNDDECDFVIFKGTHRLIKRKKFEKYIDESYVI